MIKKKIFLVISFYLITSLESCVISYDTLFYINNEEVIKINPDGSGTYSLRLYLNDFLRSDPNLLEDQPPQILTLQIDTTVFFNNTSLPTILSEEEKSMFKDGNLLIDLNFAEKKGLVTINLSYKNFSMLKFERDHIFEFLVNNIEYGVHLLFAILGKDFSVAQAINYNVSDKKRQREDEYPKLAIGLNPLGKIFSLQLFEDSVKNEIDNFQFFKEFLSSKRGMEMKNNMNYLKRTISKTTFILPAKIKGYKGNIEDLRPDGKTITFKNSIGDLFDDPHNFEYSFTY